MTGPDKAPETPYLMFMTGDQTATFLYLTLLGGAVAMWFFMQNRQRLGKVAQQALVWGLLFVGVIAGYGLWSDIRGTVLPRQSVIDGQTTQIALPMGIDGHYHVTLGLNGTPVDFIIDTGASNMVLTMEDAQRVGVADDLVFTGRAQTANGQISTARTRIATVTLGPIADRNVPAMVNGAEMPGSLLGMDYLRRFGRIEIANGEMILER